MTWDNQSDRVGVVGMERETRIVGSERGEDSETEMPDSLKWIRSVKREKEHGGTTNAQDGR